MATRTNKTAAPRVWTDAERAEILEDLLARRDELKAEYDQSMRTLKDYQETALGEGGDDSADVGSNTLEREQEMALAANSKELLVQAERALVRLDEGTYGMCETCGKKIAKARLQVFPSATQCMACKTREESR